MAAHQYWRVLFIRNANSGSLSQIAEMQMRSTPGGADLCTGGTAISSTPIQAGSAAGAFANDGTTSFIQWSTMGGSWVGYNFGAPVDIQEVVIMGAVGAAARAPGEARIQYSDDGISWGDDWLISYYAWVTGTDVVFTKPAVANHRYWRMRTLGIQAAGKAQAIAEIEFRDTLGGANQCAGGTPSGKDVSFGAAANALDLNINTFTASAGGYTDGSLWWQYDFGAGITKDIIQVSYRARNDATLFDQAPDSFVMESSPDGRSYIARWQSAGIVWTGASQVQIFSASVLIQSARMSQFVEIDIVRESAGNARISQFVMISVISGNTKYVRLTNPIELPCWQPCTAYGTHATVVIFG